MAEPVRVERPSIERLRKLAAVHAAAFAPARGWTDDEIGDLTARGLLIADPSDAGFALVGLAADEAELLTIAVDQAKRRRGLGAALLRAAMRCAAAAGATRMFLEVADDNRAASALYASAAFNEIGRRPGYYRRAAIKVDAVMLSRSLSPAAPVGE